MIIILFSEIDFNLMAALFVSAIIGFPCGAMVRERHPYNTKLQIAGFLLGFCFLLFGVALAFVLNYFYKENDDDNLTADYLIKYPDNRAGSDDIDGLSGDIDKEQIRLSDETGRRLKKTVEQQALLDLIEMETDLRIDKKY